MVYKVTMFYTQIFQMGRMTFTDLSMGNTGKELGKFEYLIPKKKKKIDVTHEPPKTLSLSSKFVHK